jgi:diguanylate cyclase (GGDEF)-like protein
MQLRSVETFMTPTLDSRVPDDPTLAKTLAKALIESERIKAIVDQAATDISCVTRVITQAMIDSPEIHSIEVALEQISAANSKVRLASAKLSVVTEELQGEARDRDMLDHRFAAALEQNEGTRQASLHDILATLPNRALFNERLQAAIAHAKKDGVTVAVMFVDLDDFKRINDSFGHAVGDRVLQTIARRLKAHTRDADTVSRHSGDEFLYLASHVRDESNIELIAQKLLREIQAPLDIDVPERENFQGAITASIGISVFPKDGATPDLLVGSADAAMYQAKRRKCGLAFAS